MKNKLQKKIKKFTCDKVNNGVKWLNSGVDFHRWIVPLNEPDASKSV